MFIHVSLQEALVLNAKGRGDEDVDDEDEEEEDDEVEDRRRGTSI